MRTMIRPQEAQLLRYPFVALPDEDGGYDLLFPDLPTVTGYAETAAGIPDEVERCLRQTFDALADAGMMAVSPGDYTGADVLPLNDRTAPEIDPAAELFTAAEVGTQLGITAHAVNAAARQAKAGRLVGNVRLFTRHDVRRLAERRPVGRPRAAD